jgi:hypothetical protein
MAEKHYPRRLIPRAEMLNADTSAGHCSPVTVCGGQRRCGSARITVEDSGGRTSSMNAVSLKAATKDDMQTIWGMQVAAFSELLEKYKDYDMSPAAEPFEKVMARYEQPWTVYYFIVAGDENVGAIRVVDKKDGSRKRISPIWIMPEHRNKGYAQAAISAVEQIYGSSRWSLDTILQEKGNLHLYEKIGYHQTGRIDKINDRMDIVFYEKD